MAPSFRSLVPGGFFSSTPFDRAMPVSIRCNNPGAINGATWEASYPGYIDTVETTPGNRTTIFEAPEFGVAVWWDLLRRYALTNARTIGEIINRYGGGQDYSNYIKFVVANTGLSDEHIIALNDDAVLLSFGKAMFHYEAGRATPLSDQQIIFGFRLGRAGGSVDNVLTALAASSTGEVADDDPGASTETTPGASIIAALKQTHFGSDVSEGEEFPARAGLPLSTSAHSRLHIDVARAQSFLAACETSSPRVTYGLGAKIPSSSSVPGRDFTKVDCSGFVREAIRRSTTPPVAFPDGSVTQHDWVKAHGFSACDVAEGASNDGGVRIAFLSPQASPSGIGHVALIVNAKTLESHGGVGPDSRPWTGRGWQSKVSVFVLTPAPSGSDETQQISNVPNNQAVADLGPASSLSDSTYKPDVAFGWRPDLPDHRDLPYAAMRLSLETTPVLPARVDLRPHCPSVYDQGSIGSCTANALAGAYEYDRIKQSLPDFVPSRLFLYFNEREIENTTDTDAGAYLRDGIKSLASTGVCREEDWTYDVTKFADRPDATCYQNSQKYLSLSYFRLNNSNLDELRSCLAAGFPFVFGFSIYNSFFNGDVDGIVPMPQNEPVIGGHAVLAVGYDDTTSRFIIRNSWGPAKGDNGYYYMPYQYLINPSLSDDFWTIEALQPLLSAGRYLQLS